VRALRTIARLLVGFIGLTIGAMAALIWGAQNGYSITFLVVVSSIAAVLSAIGAMQILFPSHRAFSKPVSGIKGRIALGVLCDSLVVFGHADDAQFEVGIITQSGNIKRMVSCRNAHEAKIVIMATFNRKQVDWVRIWRNDARCADVRINYYHGRGRSEGKVVAGIVVQRV
jgi:hypothetical protein